jgi:hypothetical protein
MRSGIKVEGTIGWRERLRNRSEIWDINILISDTSCEGFVFSRVLFLMHRLQKSIDLCNSIVKCMQMVEYRVFWLVFETEIAMSLEGLEGLTKHGPLLLAHGNTCTIGLMFSVGPKTFV